MSGRVQPAAASENSNIEPRGMSEPDRTGADMSGREGAKDVMIEQLREQLDDREEEVRFLRGELEHQRSTDQALADVIEAFRLNAGNQPRRLRVRHDDADGKSTADDGDETGGR